MKKMLGNMAVESRESLDNRIASANPDYAPLIFVGEVLMPGSDTDRIAADVLVNGGFPGNSASLVNRVASAAYFMCKAGLYVGIIYGVYRAGEILN